jgi:hypothetical protein
MAEGLTELALDRFRDRFDFERSTDADEYDLLSALCSLLSALCSLRSTVGLITLAPLNPLRQLQGMATGSP